MREVDNETSPGRQMHRSWLKWILTVAVAIFAMTQVICFQELATPVGDFSHFENAQPHEVVTVVEFQLFGYSKPIFSWKRLEMRNPNW